MLCYRSRSLNFTTDLYVNFISIHIPTLKYTILFLFTCWSWDSHHRSGSRHSWHSIYQHQRKPQRLLVKLLTNMYNTKDLMENWVKNIWAKSMHYTWSSWTEMHKVPRASFIERFHLRGQQPCKFIGTKESVYIRKEFNSHKICLKHQHGPVSLFRCTNMAVVTSFEDSLCQWTYSISTLTPWKMPKTNTQSSQSKNGRSLFKRPTS